MTWTIDTGRIDYFSTRESKVNEDSIIIYPMFIFEITPTIFLTKIMIPWYWVPECQTWYRDICSRHNWKRFSKALLSTQTSVRTMMAASILKILFSLTLLSVMVNERILSEITLRAESLIGSRLIVFWSFWSGSSVKLDWGILFCWGLISKE